ncbi:MAG: prephenate dehydratase [Candidatus Gastranaerophilaceae bacterium]
MNSTIKAKEILFLGPEGSYSHIAKDKTVELLGIEGIKPVIMRSFPDIIAAVDENKEAIAVIPIENSIEGVVRETVDRIIRTKNYVRVFQEIIIPVSNCLMSKSGELDKVKHIVSHPQPLAQCNNYIRNLSRKLGWRIECIGTESTSEGARSLSDFDDSYAAIANEKAASIYNLKIIEKNINDEPDNKTRFICIGHEYPSSTGNDKTSIAFATQNKPGELVEVLLLFKEHNLNMSYIDSRPSRKNLGEYIFYVDIDGHVEDPNLNSALEKIKNRITFYRLIGSYPKFYA